MIISVYLGGAVNERGANNRRQFTSIFVTSRVRCLQFSTSLDCRHKHPPPTADSPGPSMAIAAGLRTFVSEAVLRRRSGSVCILESVIIETLHRVNRRSSSEQHFSAWLHTAGIDAIKNLSRRQINKSNWAKVELNRN